MEGKICIVTGSNAGIGKATALGLANLGATVVMICRNQEQGQTAMEEIKQLSGNEKIDLLLADLSSQQAIHRIAAEFKRKYKQLHVLINNAGIITRNRQETIDGLEMQFAVNHLAYFLLTNLLLDVLKASAPARIINVSSMVQSGASINFDDLQNKRSYRSASVYGQTKLANVLFTYELARRLSGTGVTANCLHPGVIDTKLFANFMGRSQNGDVSLAEAKQGARTSLYLATSPKLAGVTGKYFNNMRETRSAAVSYDETVSRRLWQISAELTGVNDESNLI